MLRIKTLNCQKQPEVLKSLLNTTDPAQWDALCLQELPVSIHRLVSFRSPYWHLLLPPQEPTNPDNNTNITRSAIYLNRNILSSQYQQIHIDSPDITTVRFQQPDSTSTYTLISTYNPPSSLATIAKLQTHLNQYTNLDHIILTGNFNQHHPLWSGNQAHQRTQASAPHITPFLQLLAEHELELVLEPGTPTFYSDAHKTWSTLDLTFVSTELKHAVTRCHTDSGHGSDHRSINTHIDFTLIRRNQPHKRNWRNADWDKFNETLNILLETKSINAQTQSLTSPHSIDKIVDDLTDCYLQTAQIHVPETKPSPFIKRWWTHELTILHSKYKHLQNRAQKRHSTLADRLEAQRASREYHNAIRNQQRKHWNEWLKNATTETVYQAWKYAANQPSSITTSRLPELTTNNGTAKTNQEKCDLLYSQFFPAPPIADLDDTNSFHYPEPLTFPTVTLNEALDAIRDLSPHKAPGPTGIPNIALQRTANTLAPILTAITNAALTTAHHPQRWRHFTTITLRKPNKPDYTIAKSYRPIALEDTFSKITESIIARRLTQLAEEHSLLPPNQFGARPGKTTTDAALYLTQRIKDKWRQGKITTAVFLDIAQAFPSVSHSRLFHNLQKRRVPHAIVQWCRSFLTNRSTSLSFDDFSSPPLPASSGIPQGSPLSPILYLFYSADLLNIISQNDNHRLAGGFIDDTMIAVSSDTIAQNLEMLGPLIELSLQWSRQHACQFDITKFQLVHFTRNRRKYHTTPITIGTHTVPAADSAKYLGLILDKELRWHEQTEQAIAKGTSTVLAVARLARPAVGMPHRHIRRLYQTVVQPRMEYGLIVWYQPICANPHGRCKRGSVGIAKKLGRVQNLAARQIVGGLRSTPIDSLNYHANLLPIELHLNKTAALATTRLKSLPRSHPLQKSILRCSHTYPRFHRSSLHELLAAFPTNKPIETIDPTPTKPNWAPRFEIEIAASKEDAERNLTKYSNDFCIYTDGSGKDQHIGAAAYTLGHNRAERSRLHYLGTELEHTVFEGELVGTLLALDIILAEPRLRSATILLDNQAAIRALNTNRPQPGQQLIRQFHTQLTKLLQLRRSFKLRIVWVPGHRNIAGNERADELAKQAASGTSTALHVPLKLLKKLPLSASATKMRIQRLAQQSWLDQWQTSKYGKRTRQFDPTPPGRKTQRLYRGLSRPAGSLLTQLRSGHIGLNPYLARIQLVDSPQCPHCNTRETVEHFLLGCRKYTQARHELRIAIGRKHGTLDRRTLLATPKNFKALFTFISQTNRFKTYTDEFS